MNVNKELILLYHIGLGILQSQEKHGWGASSLRLMHCTHYVEWEAYHRIRKEQIFDRNTHVTYDTNHPSFSDKDYFHFVLYKGIDIVSVAMIEFLNEKESVLRSLATR